MAEKRTLSVLKIITIILWGLLIVSPILAGVILAAFSGGMLGDMDAWATTWNDEVEYFRSVVLMRKGFLPFGNPGYNEMLPNMPAYGAYNYLTYIPYVLFSLFTGVTTHNFMVYCNVLMIMAALAVIVLLLRPTILQSVFLGVFIISQLVFARFMWSGMSEMNTCTLMMVFIAIYIWLQRNREATEKKPVIMFYLGLSALSLACLIRPFLLVYFLLIYHYMIKRKTTIMKKWVSVAALTGWMVVLLFVWYWMAKNICVPFFPEYSLKVPQFIDLLRQGNIGQFFRDFFTISKEGIIAISQMLPSGDWAAVVPLEAVCLFFILIVVFFINLKRKAGGALFFVSALALFLIGEAGVVIDYWWVVYRFLLCPIMVGIVVCIFAWPSVNDQKSSIGSCIPAMINQLITMVLMGFMISTSGKTLFKIPFSTAMPSAEELDVIQESFVKAMPYDQNDKWGNTIAVLPWDSNAYLYYDMPLYINENICLQDYLLSAIENDSLKSRYVLMIDGYEPFVSLLESKQFAPVWKDKGYIIYKR